MAEWAGVPVDDIQRLNPEFRRWTTPVKKGEYQLKVPVGTADRVREGLAGTQPHQMNALQWHTVKKGESLATIAKKLKVNRTDLAEANYLKVDLARQRWASVSWCPACRRPRCSRALRPRRTRTPRRQPRRPRTWRRIRFRWKPPPGGAAVYRVRSGDTLYAIARKNGISVEQLKAWNNIRGSKLNVGDRIVVQSPKTANTQQ